MPYCLLAYLQGTGSRARQGPGFFQSPEEAAGLIGAGALPPSYGTAISALRINLLVREGTTEFRLSVVVSPSGGAKLVAATPANSTAPANSSSATASASAPSAGPKKLNYPFTLLEIRENGEIPTVPVADPEA